MHRTAKVKPLAQRVLLRKSAMTASAAARRGFPAWIDAGERAVAFPAVNVTPRVRDALVLRAVMMRKPTPTKGSRNANATR